MKRLFEIQTLSDHNCLGNGNGGGEVDPFTIIAGSVGLLSQLFPSIFGGSRKRLTSADWMQLFPGNGMWTVRLRNYLKASIHYDTDWGNVEPFTRNFVYENMSSLPGGSFDEKFQAFLRIIAEEKYTGGKSPGGMIPGIAGTLDYSTLIPLALGGVILVLMMKKKKKK